ncbi:MAG TPA: hypothetical protein VJ352_16095 [Geodermatophilus sp.]|jgi:hypothetical protein|nr:hypothetical protein [Geodermatophilus sp.]
MIETIDGATPAAAPCPSWCIDGADCGSEHHGEVWGTVATGGLPPIVDNIEAPTYNTVCVQPQHDEADGLPPHVALFGSWNGDNWQADLTVAEARATAQALLDAAATAEGSASGDASPPA